MSHFCHFWAFWPLSQWSILEGGCCHDILASNLSLSGRCLPSLTSVAQGMLYFVQWWTLLYVQWWTLFYCGSLPWRSLLCQWGHDLNVWGSPFLLGPPAVGLSMQLGKDHHQCICCSSVQSASIFSSEMKLEKSFSTVSYFIFLALTQLSKVLKWTLLFSIFNIWGLERNQIFTDLSYCVLGSRYFSSQTYPWSWKKSVCFCFWPNLCLECVPGSWKESTFVSVALYCLMYHWLGSWNEFPWVFFSLLTHIPIYMKGLERSLKCCSYVLLWGLCWLF